MLVRFALGTELDIASKGELDESTDQLLDAINGRKHPRPVYTSVSKSATIPDPFTGTVEIGSPPTSRVWEVLAFSACGLTDSAQSSGGVYALYIGDVPASGVPTLSQLRVPRLVIPTSQTFSQKTQWCPSASSLFVNCTALAGITQIVLNVFVAEWREADVLDNSGR